MAALQRLRLRAWLLLGNGFLLVGGLALCALPLAMCMWLPGAAGLLAGFVTLPAGMFGYSMLKLPFATRADSSEDGIALQAVDAPQLFEEIERLRLALGAPALDAVYLNDDFNASIRQHHVLFRRTRNVMWLGLPLLDTLSPRACAAILAHECAHIAQRHGRYASRVYFARLQWQAASERLERHRSLSSAPLRLFVGWYVPRFLAVSMDFARRCEYQADAEAARVGGVEAMREALVGLALQGRALEQAFWPKVFLAGSATPLTDLARSGAPSLPQDIAEARSWLHGALCNETDDSDTHPALADRLAALGGAPDQPDAALVWQRSQPSAAQAWLGEQHLPLAQRLDEQQADDNARHCQRARDEREALVAEQHDLQRKRRIRALSGHEIARLAWLYRTLGEAGDEALRLLEDALQQAPDAAVRYQLAECHAQAGRPDAAAALWRQVAEQRGPLQLYSLRKLSVLALRGDDRGAAEHYRREADALQRADSDDDGEDGEWVPHDLVPVERNKLIEMLTPLLKLATGVWLLRETGTRRYILLVLARDSLTFRLVSRLTGEDSYLRRDCQQMLNRLLPRIRLDLVPVVMSAGDARLVFCSQASQLRLSALL